VTVGSDYFDPAGLSVDPGTTVRFELESGSHSVTAYEDRIPEAAAPFDSGVFSEGAFEHTFEAPGTYDYYCTPHRAGGMVGRIVIGDPGGPAEESPIPDGDVPESDEIVAEGSVDDDGTGRSRGHGGGMMGSGSGMHGGDRRWMALVPVGVLTTVLGLVGGVAYWGARRGSASGEARFERRRDDDR